MTSKLFYRLFNNLLVSCSCQDERSHLPGGAAGQIASSLRFLAITFFCPLSAPLFSGRNFHYDCRMWVNAAGHKVYYEKAGQGTALLMLHGWGVSSETFRPLLLRLAAHCDVRAIDLPGFGQSEMPPEVWGTEEYAELVKNILDAWNIQKADILGHSFGARVALRLAHRYPERVGRIVLTGAAGIRIQKPVPFPRRLLVKAGRFAGNCGAPGRWLKERIYQKIGSADYLAAGAMRPILVKVVNEDMRGILPAIPHTVSLIWGGNDRDTTLEAARIMHEGLKNSALEVLPGAGHYAFLDQPDAFYTLLKKGLDLP